MDVARRDEAGEEIEDWSREAAELLEERDRGPADDLLARVLTHLGAGVRLRRSLDGTTPDAEGEASRRALARRLAELRRLAEDEMGGLEPGSAAEQVVAGRLKGWVAEARIELRKALGDTARDGLGQALAIEGLRADLEWLGVIVARLDGEPPPSRTSALEVEIDRVCDSLCRSAGPGERADDPAFSSIRARCERMRGALLERRVQQELTRSTAGATPERLLATRVHLSRLQARVASLEPEDGPEGQWQWLQGSPSELANSLAVHRVELAELTESSLCALPLEDVRRPAERCLQVVRDETSETIAFLQDMPLARAVTRLELAQEDLDQLSITLRRLTLAPDPEPAGEDEPGTDDGDSREDEAVRAGDDHPESVRRWIDREIKRLERLRRRIRDEWQEKLLALRLEWLLGRRGVSILENLVLALIAALAGLIVGETLLDRAGKLTDPIRARFAWADLVICSILLGEFLFKLALAPRKGLYFLRHMVIDFIASLPFGFFSYQITSAQVEERLTRASETLRLLRYLRFGRLVQMLRYVRLALPVVRLARVALFALRLSDRLVRRNGGLLNRNIVLFEPHHDDRGESGVGHRLHTLRSEVDRAGLHLGTRLDVPGRQALCRRILGDLDIRLETLPRESIDAVDEETQGREIPVEALVDRLIQLSPERLVDRFGTAFVNRADRYLRLLDAPLVRRLPIIRNLVAYRAKSPAEAVALAANYVGHLIQRFLDIVYFLADLQGTLSPPIFLDRLGATIVNATRTPAKRLLWLGTAFLILFLTVNTLPFLRPFRGFVERLQNLLGWPVIVLGAICLVFWTLGSWFRKIANQSSDFCERIVEAQFAAQTKYLKSRRRDQDYRFLAERVIDPELILRSSDDHMPELYRDHGGPAMDLEGRTLLENRERIFLRNVRLLYQDYLDGSPFHRSDTKASVQLLGNLALANLRRSHLGHLLREGRALDRLDLSRAGNILGGPYLWFNYITRIIVQETAMLLLDYNRHAIPLERLACSSPQARRAYQAWLSRRLRIEPDEVRLPEPLTPMAEDDAPGPEGEGEGEYPMQPRRPEAAAFLETVEFTAIDFLTDDPERDTAIRSRFGDQVAELVMRDRQQNVRRAFRSFPLHELPLAQRTINPFAFYEHYLSRGRIVLFPLIVFAGLAKSVLLALRGVYRGVHEILHPRIDQDREIPSDTYWAALRKIHRMRKPVFMGSLWLRARFDVEYLGLPLPTAPPGIAAESLMETDLDFIGASRQDRIITEQIRAGHQRRMEWLTRWLVRFGWTFDRIPSYLAREMPHLSNRGGEALRALVTACVLDHDDITSLAFSIEGLTLAMAHATRTNRERKSLPAGLPDPVINLRKLWRPVHRVRRPVAGLFELPCFPRYDRAQQARILRYLKRHRRAFRGWWKVVLGQGGPDPWSEVKSRMREVLLKTDLWSDQVLVLRAVQTLTMLDLQHNCDLVWSLGGYTHAEPTTEQDREQEASAPTEQESDLPVGG